MAPFAYEDLVAEGGRSMTDMNERTDVTELAAIFAGGVAGALARVWIGLHLVSAATGWPWSTFLINVSGTAVLAYATTRLQERLPPSTYRRPLIGTGFCGAFTTFSTLQVELVTMLDAGRIGLAAGYAAASLAAGWLAVWLTTGLVRRARVR
jgi:fluoride exporter